MATISFDRLASGTIKVTNGTNPVVYYAGLGYELNPNAADDVVVIKISNGDEYRLEAADTVNVNGTPTTGTTATEIAEDLATDIFFLASSGGGGGVSLDESNTFTEAQTIQKTFNGLVNFTVLNLHASGQTGVNLYSGEDTEHGVELATAAGVATARIFANYNTAATLQANAAGGLITLNIASAANGFQILYSSTVMLTFPAEGINDYANDAAAATGGVPVTGLYRTASALKIRVA